MNNSAPHCYERSFEGIDAAQDYYFIRKTLVIGRSPIDAALLSRLKMPALPLLQSNRVERLALMKKPWFITRCFWSAIEIIKQTWKDIQDARKQEIQKKPKALKLKDILLPALPGEYVDPAPISIKEFRALI